MSVWIEPPTAFIRLGGRAAAEGARDFKALVLRLEAEGIGRFCLDLTQCLLMDSTFSGVLASLAHAMGLEPTHGCKRFTLVGANSRIRDLLDNLGVLELVHVLEGQPAQGFNSEAEEVLTGASDRQGMTVCCLEAHRFLMALKPENESKFQEVTRILESQLSPASSTVSASG